MKRRWKKLTACLEKLYKPIRKRKFVTLGFLCMTMVYMYELYRAKVYLSHLELLNDKFPMMPNRERDADYQVFVTTGLNGSNMEISANLMSLVLPKKDAKTTKRTPPPVVKTFPPQPPERAPGPDTRYLVYLCEDGHRCGGWGDRQKGLTSAYLLARITEREFKIMMPTPCDLSIFFGQNFVKWQPKTGELDTESEITVVGIGNESVTKILASSDFNTQFPQKVVYFRTNSDYYYHLRHNNVYSKLLSHWSAIGDKKTRFRWAWNDLMIPTERILKSLQRLVGPGLLIDRGLSKKPVTIDQKYLPAHEVGSSPLVCAHVRIGKNPTNPKDDTVEKFKLDDVPALYEFMRGKDKDQTSRYFVATDSGFVRRLTTTFFGDKAVEYAGFISHIDRQRDGDEACSGFEIALVEQMILSLCDFLVLSESGFSLHAAFISNSSFGQVYKIEGGVPKTVM